jgi:hypothetical protein
VLPFPEPYALNRSTGVTQGKPFEGTSSTQPGFWAWFPDRKRGLPTSGTLPYPRQPTPAAAFILVGRTRVKMEHGLHCKTVTSVNRSTGGHKGQPCHAGEPRKS